MVQKVRIELPEEVKTGKGEHPFCALGTKIFIDDKQIHNTTDISVHFPVHGPVVVKLTILVMDGSEVEFDGYAEVEEKKEYVDVSTFGLPGKRLESE